MLMALGILEQEAARRADSSHLAMIQAGGGAEVFKGSSIVPNSATGAAVFRANVATQRYEHENRRHLRLLEALCER